MQRLWVLGVGWLTRNLCPFHGPTGNKQSGGGRSWQLCVEGNRYPGMQKLHVQTGFCGFGSTLVRRAWGRRLQSGGGAQFMTYQNTQLASGPNLVFVLCYGHGLKPSRLYSLILTSATGLLSRRLGSLASLWLCHRRTYEHFKLLSKLYQHWLVPKLYVETAMWHSSWKKCLSFVITRRSADFSHEFSIWFSYSLCCIHLKFPKKQS